MNTLIKKIQLACLLLALACLGSSPACATPAAMFDTQAMTLSLAQLRIDGSVTFSSVVLRFLDFGQVRVNDPSVGTSIEFLPASNTLRIPQLTLGGAQFHNVSLTAPVAAIVSYGPVIIDPGMGGGSTLVVRLNVSGTDMGEVARLVDVPRPANQAEFCGDARLEELRQTITQQSGGAIGTLTLNACSFDGTNGRIALQMSIQSAGFAMNIPYVATYVYQ